MKAPIFGLIALVLSAHIGFAAGLEQAPSFSARTLENKTFQFKSGQFAKPLLLVFWATWCSSCKREIPRLKQFHTEHAKEIDVIAISIDTDLDALKQAIQSYKIDYMNLVDSESNVASLFGVDSTPALFAIDTRGAIKQRARELKTLTPQLLALAAEKTPSVTRETILMGTEISFVIQSNETQKANETIDAAIAEMKRIEDLMTDWRESKLMNINHMAGIKPIKVDSEIFFMLEEAKTISALTQGAFDITYASAGGLWNFLKQDATPPSDSDIKKALKLVGYQNLILDKQEQSAFLKKKGMKIGLGGIAKGYAVDKAIELIEKKGFKDFAVNAGGDLAVRGKNNGWLWNVAIQDPRDKSKNFALLPISNGSVVTSGDNERFFIHNGKRYAHIIDPRTGYPARECQSVTVLAKKTYWADALATAIYILGPIEGMKIFEKQGIEGVIIDAKGKVQVSKGLQKQVKTTME